MNFCIFIHKFGPKRPQSKTKKKFVYGGGGLTIVFSVQGGSRGAERWMETIDCKLQFVIKTLIDLEKL